MPVTLRTVRKIVGKIVNMKYRLFISGSGGMEHGFGSIAIFKYSRQIARFH